MKYQMKKVRTFKTKAKDGFGTTLRHVSSFVDVAVLQEGNRFVMMDLESDKELANLSENGLNLLLESGYLKTK